jgi:hypothetical protein
MEDRKKIIEDRKSCRRRQGSQETSIKKAREEQLKLKQ